MEANFQQALKWVRESEGGNDDDPVDAGGRTSRGITQREYDAYCRMAGLDHGDVWKAPDQVVDDIYHRSYWMPYCPHLPAGVDYMFFDHAVLAGSGAAILALQRALKVLPDGHFGILTSEALSKADSTGLIDGMAAQRLAYYDEVVREHPQDRKFIKGWRNRVSFAMKNAHTLVNGDHV